MKERWGVELLSEDPYYSPNLSLEREKALGVSGALGVIWLKDGLGGERSEATDTSGLGLWVLYALSEHWHLEMGAMGAASGDARFHDVTVDGTQGELTRSAKLGRLQGSAFLRLGTEGIMPYVRFGVGAQLTSYSEVFSAGEAPESSIEGDVVLGGGAGAQIRLGDHLIAGAAFGFDAELGGASRHFQGGLHLGYTWQPLE